MLYEFVDGEKNFFPFFFVFTEKSCIFGVMETKDKYGKALKKLYKLLHEYEGYISNSFTQDDALYTQGQVSGIKAAIDCLHQHRIAEKQTK